MSSDPAASRLPPPGAPLLRVRGVTHTFGAGDAGTVVLKSIDLEVMPGELVIMSGPSGCGKTTLLTLIGGLRGLQAGEIEVWDGAAGDYHRLRGLDEAGLVRVRRLIGFIFQRHNLFDSLGAAGNVRLARDLFPPGADDDARIRTLLTYLGLGRKIDSKPHGLSGGQRQRVAVARALVNRPRLVLADEPTAALDADFKLAVVTLLQHLARARDPADLDAVVQDDHDPTKYEDGRVKRSQADLLPGLTREKGTTSLIVTHDAGIMNRADRVVHMEGGRIVSNVVVAERLFVTEGLRRCGFFAAILPEQQQVIADGVCVGVHPGRPAGPTPGRVEVFARGQVIVRQGDPVTAASKFYLIRRGRVRVARDEGDGRGPQPVRELGPQDFFGDRALVFNTPRNATVTAVAPTEVYTVGIDTFARYKETSRPFIERIVEVFDRGRPAS